ncbi:DinG family ATP-dependent helicase YoaA [hydrothermal vent metagenome]|uniref:DNA 5'-3' helicase n=1 Tax=hydrothermal vent metagenome TaxID=652676 RepID=A0A3B1AUF5_9ZZZZ
MNTPSEILGLDGLLAKHVAGFAPRSEQQEMADAVAQTLEQNSILIAEAGTGTGKTFAYLVPALLCGQKVIISTGTKNLQDQLFHRDLPVVRKALEVPVSVALLKGRNNYLCLHRLEVAEEGRYSNREMSKSIQLVRSWSRQTKNGDIAELSALSEADPVWPRVTSGSDNCLGVECGFYDKCHLMEARRLAQAADVVVVNHHLLLADMALREGGFGELLPAANAFIIDEAHQLPDVASGFFGTSMSSQQLMELARDAEAEYITEINEGRDFSAITDALQTAVQDMRLAFELKSGRGGWRDEDNNKALPKTIDKVIATLENLQSTLKPLAVRSKGLDNCLRRAAELNDLFHRLTGSASEDQIHWYEIHKRSFSINLTPLSIADSFQSRLNDINAAWVFTSATLAVGDHFDLFQQQLGLVDAQTAQWASPFDYYHQSLFYVPRDLPLPNDRDYTRAVIDSARPVIESCGGRTFLLFTSHRALREAAELLENTIDFPLLIQGDEPRDILLEKFRQQGNAVLLGTSSFWEGVDVRGDALSCVIIDKLPFASPGDPVLQGRIEAMRKQGKNPFMDFQLPNAAITLKQGVGRLIRDVNDHGILMICDPRLLDKPYGRIFLESLPKMARTRDVADIARFFEYVEKRTAVP